MKDLGGIEPPKSFRNTGDSVPYGALEESDKLKFDFPGRGLRKKGEPLLRSDSQVKEERKNEELCLIQGQKGFRVHGLAV